MATNHVLFARVGWMKRYKGQQADDEKPVGGGGYNKTELGHELFNFLRIGGKVFGYFQPQLQPPATRKLHPSTVKLERIEQGFAGEKLKNVLVVFVARHPKLGGQRIVGWFRKAIVYRHSQKSTAKARNRISYYVETSAGNEVLVPEPRRSFVIRGGKHGFGQANVCYVLDSDGRPKNDAEWIESALAYVSGYEQEDAAEHPESETDPEIAEIVDGTIERSAGFQSNPRIRQAIEQYAMGWALKRLKQLGLKPVDVHKNKPYDFLCKTADAELFVEVKGTQDNGESISLTPNEVKHARQYKNSALFIVHSVKVKGKKSPKISRGHEIFIPQWDISKGTLKPRGYVFTLPASS
jgi:hypothetical protein